MSLAKVVKSGLVALLPVVAALAAWILVRSNDLVRLSAGMDPGFLTPESRMDAITTGLIIWVPISIILCFGSAIAYWFAAAKWHWRAWHFALLPIGLAVLVSVAAFVQGMAFKVEATGESDDPCPRVPRVRGPDAAAGRALGKGGGGSLAGFDTAFCLMVSYRARVWYA